MKKQEPLDTKTINKLAQAEYAGQVAGGLFLLYAIIAAIIIYAKYGFCAACFGWFILTVEILHWLGV